MYELPELVEVHFVSMHPFYRLEVFPPSLFKVVFFFCNKYYVKSLGRIYARNILLHICACVSCIQDCLSPCTYL
ncbi:hypothetical protein DSO57_1005187 [Entomophthora muscae]|uniref:Uncharacterized protein n=1 Tax=Entomophthora muscae TaxID=34485 RepID=A0ACC2SKM6_9FUNG|nr:hypothetical protein DSO57_1005187 [Entomophthora muscae]